jgi:CheY-specific phosphatase CheX
MSEVSEVAGATDQVTLSQSAQDGFDLLLEQALRGSLVPADEQAGLTVLPDLAGINETQMVVLTVSSYLFRVMVMFHFTADAATRAHFARLNKVAAAEMSEQAFMDAIAECGNLCCGVLNRDLGNFFPHLGMSTPNVIDSRCAAYLQTLNATHVRHFAVDIPDTRRFHVSLCISAYADMDFAVSAQEIAVDTGELELF